MILALPLNLIFAQNLNNKFWWKSSNRKSKVFFQFQICLWEYRFFIHILWEIKKFIWLLYTYKIFLRWTYCIKKLESPFYSWERSFYFRWLYANFWVDTSKWKTLGFNDHGNKNYTYSFNQNFLYQEKKREHKICTTENIKYVIFFGKEKIWKFQTY